MGPSLKITWGESQHGYSGYIKASIVTERGGLISYTKTLNDEPKCVQWLNPMEKAIMEAKFMAEVLEWLQSQPEQSEIAAE